MSVNAAAGHTGQAQMLSAAQAFANAKPDQKRSHDVVQEVRQTAFAPSGQDRATDGITAGHTLDIEL